MTDEPNPGVASGHLLMASSVLADLMRLVLSEDDQTSMTAIRRLRGLAQEDGRERDLLEGMARLSMLPPPRTAHELVIREELSAIVTKRRLDRLGAIVANGENRLTNIDRRLRTLGYVILLGAVGCFFTGFGAGDIVGHHRAMHERIAKG